MPATEAKFWAGENQEVACEVFTRLEQHRSIAVAEQIGIFRSSESFRQDATILVCIVNTSHVCEKKNRHNMMWSVYFQQFLYVQSFCRAKYKLLKSSLNKIL